MELRLDLDGIVATLQITDYCATAKDDYMSDEWCGCKLRIVSEGWLDYNQEGELLLSCEVEELRNEFNNLLNGKIHSIKEISFTEPDFEFVLIPIQDVRKNPDVLYCAPGFEFTDISVEWKIHFWNGGLTANFLSLTLDRDDLMQFTDYLSKVTQIR